VADHLQTDDAVAVQGEVEVLQHEVLARHPLEGDLAAGGAAQGPGADETVEAA
jgi:hypothetical protein